MPLVVAAFCAYAAGLLLGFGGALVAGALLTAALLATAFVRRQAAPAALAATLVAASCIAREAARADDRCAREIRSSGGTTVRLRSPLAPGRAARATTTHAECRVAIRVHARAAQAAAGSTLFVRGQFARRGRGLMLRDAEVHLVATPRLLDRWRARVGARLDALYGDDAPLARALLLADADDVDREVRDRFADAGIVHMLSVSGLHVGIIAGAVRVAAGTVRAGAVTAELVSLAVSALFVLFIGARPPAVRAIVMLALRVTTRLAQRPTAVWAIWAVSCAVALAEPRNVLDLGWQLSTTGMAGLLASGPLSRRWCGTLRAPFRRLAEGVLATALASVATAPLVAWVFGRVSVAALATNLVAGPLFGVGQPLLFASLVLAPVDPVARFLAGAARVVLWLVDWVARVGAAMPGGVVQAQPDRFTAACVAVAAAAVIVAAVSRHPRRAVLWSLGAVALATWRPLLPLPGARLELHALDVGQGDALAIRTPRGRWILVDVGGAWRSGDAASLIVPYLRRHGGQVVLLVTSHPHADHIGGAASLLRRLAVDTLWDGAYVTGGTVYRAMLDASRAQGTVWRRVARGDSAIVDGVGLHVLAPDSAWIATLDDPNDASVVLRVSYGQRRFLLTGDAEEGAETWLVERYGEELRADVLKVAHHGSATSSSPRFLAAVRPRVAIISVGAGNRYGHPAPSVLQRLDAGGTQLLRTDDEGTIVLSTDGRVLDVKADGATWRYFSVP